MGSISVMMTREPYERSDSAHCRAREERRGEFREGPSARGGERETHALADVTVAGDDRDLASKHDVGGTLDAVDERLAAAVEVVELGLGDRAVR